MGRIRGHIAAFIRKSFTVGGNVHRFQVSVPATTAYAGRRHYWRAMPLQWGCLWFSGGMEFFRRQCHMAQASVDSVELSIAWRMGIQRRAALG